MKIEIETKSYNQRRYGKPWIAIVKFSNNPKGEYVWGDFIGSQEAGLLVIDAHEGDIIARGQKDHRGNGTFSQYYQVRDGKLVYLDGGKPEAYKLATA